MLAGREQVAAFGFRKTLGGKTQAKNESSSPALLPAEWRLQKKKKKEMQRKIRQYLEAQIFRVYQIPTAVTNGNAWKYGFQTIFDYVGCIFSYLRSAKDKQGGSAMTLKVDLGKCARVYVANK